MVGAGAVAAHLVFSAGQVNAVPMIRASAMIRTPTRTRYTVFVPSLDAQSEVRRDARGVHTREVLLRAAERLFAEQGIARTSTRQITAEAGISRDAVHYHFGSKSGLVLAIVDARTGELRVDWNACSR